MVIEKLFNNPIFPQFVPEQGWNLGEEAWNKASMHVLFVFPANPLVRCVSQTHSVLYSILKAKYGDDVFVDISFMPFPQQEGLYYKNYPAIVGSFSKRTWEDFDVLGISIAITMTEFAQMYKLLHLANIPIHSSDRIKDDKYPLVLLGGISCDNSSAFDKVVDLYTYGLGERQLPKFFDVCLEGQKLYGSIRKAKGWIQTVAPLKVQGVYNPANYHYHWNNVGGHIESYYDGADENYPTLIKPDVAIPMDYIYVRDTNRKWSFPGNQRKASITSSLGCSGAGTCNFSFEENTLLSTDKGLIPLKEVKPGMKVINPKGQLEPVTAVYDLRDEECIKITTSGGYEVVCSPDHDLADTDFNIKLAKDFKVGDCLNLNFDLNPVESIQFDPEMFLAGFYFGDGSPSSVNSASMLIGKNNPECEELKTFISKCAGKELCWREQETEWEALLGYRDSDLAVSPAFIRAYGDKEVNVSLLTSLTKDKFLSWFAGLVVTDGTIEKVGKTIQIGQVREESIHRLQKVLAYFGIPCRYDVSKYKQSDSHLERFHKYAGREIVKHRLTFPRQVTLALGKPFAELLFGRKRERFLEGLRETKLQASTYNTYLKKLSKIKSIESVGVKHTWNLTVEPSHLVTVGGAIASFQCHESSLYASWRERPYEKMVEGLQVAKKTSMGETFSYESFNHNFVSDFPGSLKLAYKYFDRISVINFRLDALAASIRNDGEYNYLRLLKELGTISVSGAVEGFGQRVRDCIMNKNLSFDDWLTVEREAFRMKFIRVKNGFVLSGFETKDDWKEAADEVRQIMDARDQMNSNSIYMMSCTKLVHNAGTPLYYKPRIMSYVNWQESFNPDFYYYPFMPFVDMGVKMHLCSGKGDTFVQQLLQDLPADLAEEIILKPALVYPVMSADYLKAVKSAMERYDIDPKEQFLHFNVKYHPHQHQRISNNDKVVQEEGPDKYFTHGHPQCLKTPALVSKGITPKCKSCGACEEVDAVCKEEGITEDIQGFKNHKAWTLTRPLQTKYDIADIKTVKLANAPSFWYTFAMLYTEKGRLISKENLLRQWWKKVAEKAPEQAENFRRFGYYTAKYLDYDSLASNYYGYDMVTVGFRDRLPADIEEAFKYANENCEGIQYISWSPDQSVGRPNYKILVELEFNLPLEDLQKVIDIYSKEDFRIYSETLQYPEMVSFPFDYKFLRTKTGTYKMYLIMPPLANPAYSLMCNWNFNDLQKIVKSMRVRSILNPTEEGQYLDVITHKNVNTSGFIHIDKALVEKEEIDDDAPEAEGA